MEEQPFDFNTPITEDITLVPQFDCPSGVTLNEFKTALDNGTAKETYPVNTQIDDYTNGTYDPWVVGHYGKEYGNSNSEGVYLYRKYLYSVPQTWGTTSDYATSTIHTWLNSTYLDACSDEFKGMVKEIAVPTVNAPVQAKIFLMSGVETLCLSPAADGGMVWDSWKERTKLTTPDTNANEGRKMSAGELTNGGEAWYLRSVNLGAHGVVLIADDGSCRISAGNEALGIAPACFIPSDYSSSLTAAEYDALNITAQAYNDKQITARDYNDKAKEIPS